MKIFTASLRVAIFGCILVGCAPYAKDFKYNEDIRLLLVKIPKPYGGHGSGILDTQSGFVFTNAHVVYYNGIPIDRNSPTVQFESGAKCFSNRMASRPQSSCDLELLQIEKTCIFPDQPKWHFAPLEKTPNGAAGILYGHMENGNQIPVIFENISTNPSRQCRAWFLSPSAQDPHGSSGGPIVIDGSVRAITSATPQTGVLKVDFSEIAAIPIEEVLKELYLDHP
jgi:hypothetical protein